MRIFAGTSFIEIVRPVVFEKRQKSAFRIDDATFHTFLFLDEDFSSVRIKVCFEEVIDKITISSQRNAERAWTAHAAMRARNVGMPATIELRSSSMQNNSHRHVSQEEFYGVIGNNYQGEFRTARESWVNAGQMVLSRIRFDHMRTSPYIRAGAWLDACNQTSVLLSQMDRHANSCVAVSFISRPFFAAGVERYDILAIDPMQTREMWAVHVPDPAAGLEANQVRIFSGGYKCVACFYGCTGQTADAGTLERARVQRDLYHVEWLELADAVAASSSSMLLLGAAHPSVRVGDLARSKDFAASTLMLLASVSGDQMFEALPFLRDVLGLVQGQIGTHERAQFWIVSPAAGYPRALRGAPSGVLGLARTARTERSLQVTNNASKSIFSVSVFRKPNHPCYLSLSVARPL